MDTSDLAVNFYADWLQPLLFSGLRADPEAVGTRLLQTLNWLDHSRHHFPAKQLLPWLTEHFTTTNQALSQTLWGKTFPNPIGLAAGFDKDGLAVGIWPHLGFGFAEIGTVTALPQPGNPKPRLFRLPQDQAALNRMGFNNQGSAALAQHLQTRLSQQPLGIPLGINLGKSKITPLERAAQDYLESFQHLQPWGDYFVINVSSPNTPGLRSLQSPDSLLPILQCLQSANTAHKPLFLKISPDLEWSAIAQLVHFAQTCNLAGVIATNTTLNRQGLRTPNLPSDGGISGAPLRQCSTDIIRFIWRESNGKIPIIGVGGIFTPDHAWEKITAGACLLQVYTGWIYEGPGMIRHILKGLSQKLQAEGFSHLSQAVGSDKSA